MDNDLGVLVRRPYGVGFVPVHPPLPAEEAADAVPFMMLAMLIPPDFTTSVISVGLAAPIVRPLAERGAGATPAGADATPPISETPTQGGGGGVVTSDVADVVVSAAEAARRP